MSPSQSALQEADAPTHAQAMRQLGERLILELVQKIDTVETLPELWLSRTRRANSAPLSRDVDGGVAGVVLVLARAAEGLCKADVRRALAKAAHWLAASEWFPSGPLPGLYVGEAGVSVALLRAGITLGDGELVELALERSRLVAALPHVSPDLFNGTAGRLRAHLGLWRACGDARQLEAALVAGEHLIRQAEPTLEREVCWRMPLRSEYGSAKGKTYLGYAHGAAGVADALLDLYEATGESRFVESARAGARWILRHASATLEADAGRDWADEPRGQRTGALWCHGAAGVGRFFLHCALLDEFDGALEIASRAARTVAATRWCGPSQCHGLAGNGELLLDMFAATGASAYLDGANALAQLAAAFALATPRENLVDEDPFGFGDDFMQGKAGVAEFFLRSGIAAQRPHLLSVAGLAGL